MFGRIKLLAISFVLLLGTQFVSAKNTFTYSFQGDLKGLDPHALYETFQLATISNVYESLFAYDKDLKLVPQLAKSYKSISPTKWEIKLRRGVKFHNGNSFNAKDVKFSFERALSTDMAAAAKKISKIEIKDNYTVILHTKEPNPLLPNDINFLFILDKEWTEKHKADKPKAMDENIYTTLNANGTGPFEVVSYQAGVKSVFKRFKKYWNNDNIKTNVDEVVFRPISQDSTRVAALLSGSLDLAYPIPLQDQKRVKKSKKLNLLTGAETRSIFMGFDIERDELIGSNVKGKNPFKDKRVREAFNYAVNLNLINKKIMRSTATPLGILAAPAINGYTEELGEPYPYDLKKARKLMKEAGYAKGFSVMMDCPNDRYVNDEKICQAVSSMLSKIKVKVNLNAQPKNKFFAKVLASNNFDTSFYLLGWSPSSLDSHNVIYYLLSCRDVDKGTGLYNLGNYCNKKVDALGEKVQVEMNPKKRQDMINEAFDIVKKDFGFLPIHAQALSWGTNKRIKLVQRANNGLDWRDVVIVK